jgi:hypothetical protein
MLKIPGRVFDRPANSENFIKPVLIIQAQGKTVLMAIQVLGVANDQGQMMPVK